MKLTFILFLIIACTSCNDKKTQGSLSTNTDTTTRSESKAGFGPITKPNSMLVGKSCVIFLWPDSIELAKLQAENDEDTYNEIVADLTWYPGTASEVLDSLKIENFNCDKDSIILFNGSTVVAKYKRKDLKGDMILFNINKEPQISWANEFDKNMTLKYFDK
jgi:hypothetical protein